MVGHAFGWSVAVYNYNRRARLKQEVMRKLFCLPCFAYYDDTFGLETSATIESAEMVARGVHEMLGMLYGEHKVKVGAEVDILGVAYRLPLLRIGITTKRKRMLQAEISDILQKDSLSPGHAGKLKGKLNFAASQLWGKIGRALMPTLPHRKYGRKQACVKESKFKVNLKPHLKQRIIKRHQDGTSHKLDAALRRSLNDWHALINDG